jgi:flagellar hook-basal body complex protein FliE
MSEIKIITGPVQPSLTTGLKPKAPAGTDENFGDLLANAIKTVEDLQGQAGEAQDKLIRGDAADLHQVMIAAEKAGLSFELLLEVRRRLLEAYQEIVRMPI